MDMLPKIALLVAIVAVPLFFVFRKKLQPVPETFPKSWRQYLLDTVKFYRNQGREDRHQFEEDILYFLSHHKITGISTEITEHDKLLVASSAVIPIFGFPEWHYHNLDEVILYGQSFNHRRASKTRPPKAMWEYMNLYTCWIRPTAPPTAYPKRYFPTNTASLGCK